MTSQLRFRASELLQRIRTSLFLVPMVYVVAGILVGQLGLVVDRALDLGGSDLPVGMASTVGSARAVLTTVASATMTVAGVAFSISLLVLQLASSQYSPRVVHGLFRDPQNKRVMGIVLGTFTYCLVVLRGVHAPVEDGGDAVIPTISVTAGVLFGILAIVAIVAFINHNAHATDVSNLLAVTTRQAIDQARKVWGPEPERTDDGGGPREPMTQGPAKRANPRLWAAAADERSFRTGPRGHLRLDTSGWVRQLDTVAMLECLPARTSLRCDIIVGDYVTSRQVVGELWPASCGDDRLYHRLRTAVVVGTSRAIQHDPLYGVRQLVDVALRALSSGINDPTTAEDAIAHLGELVQELLVRTPPPRIVEGEDGRCIALPRRPQHDGVLQLAFDELRRESATRPRIGAALLDTMASLATYVGDVSTRRTLDGLARNVVDGARAHAELPGDLHHVEKAFAAFSSAAGVGGDGGTDRQRVRDRSTPIRVREEI